MNPLTAWDARRSMQAMNAWEPVTAVGADKPAERAPAFALRRAAPEGRPPPTALGARAIRRSEDALVDDLIASAPELGAAVIAARVARAYIDVNREPFELDATMFADELPDFARARTARVAAGLGAIARVVSE